MNLLIFFITHNFFIFAEGYKLLNNLVCELPKKFEPCKNINMKILNIVKDVFNDLQNIGLPIFLDRSNNTVCNSDFVHYGQMLYNDNIPNSKTDLLFKTSLIYTPITAYNVILHEVLHSLGLDHNNGEYGLMNYAVNENWFGLLNNDDRKLWLSADDINGVFNNCM